ncbi:MAG: hypothetical protein R3277_00765 [Brumimicrobium sp.]|nr:hypothetical protein [Brumimicrobium sp.]
MSKSVYFFFLLFLVLSCSEKSKAKKEQTEKIALETQGLINWRYFNDFSLKHVSFPLWFDGDIVNERQIRAIHLSYFETFEPDSIERDFDTLPVKKRSYFFKNGFVKEFRLKEFHAEINVATHYVSYNGAPDETGYSKPNISNDLIYKSNQSLLTIFSIMEAAQLFKRLELVKEDSLTKEYRNTLSPAEENHVFILDSSNWNVLFIDKNYQPGDKTIYYYGTPEEIHEVFRLKNLVMKNRILYNEYHSSKMVKNQSFFNNGFETRRNFNYDQNGQCLGYSDSLFSVPDEFISSTKTRVFYKDGLPLHISTYREEDTLFKNVIKKISVDYEFR